ncbi:MAG TPA: DNA polymerase III subunit beta [Anaerolineaceae bacterium]|nr:DNA polymerase III subunit beta [Anaerolineaceae bacterium]HPN51497.1 DNA polymerase III subunit beta [Anaerolineaceae bacterium]
MKVTVPQQQLAHGLSVVSRAVSPRNTLPVLANILIATDEGRLRLSATNLELGITCWINARVDEEGSTTMPARTFADLVNALPNDQVSMTLNAINQTLTVRCGSSTTDIKGIDAQEFPPMPVPDPNDGVTVRVGDFKEMIQQVAFAASTDDVRPVLTGVLVTINGTDMTMAATDGFRVSIRKATIDNLRGYSASAIIPARALTELARIATEPEGLISMTVPAGRGQVIFHMKDVELVSQLIDGNFPDYKAIVPRSFKTRTILSTAALLKACKQAEIIAREGTNVARLNINPSDIAAPGHIEVSAQSEQTGSSEAMVDATVDGVPLLIAFNVKFLREVLEIIKTPNVVIETNAANSPGMVRPVGDETFTHVIMPMHLG